VSLFFCTIHLIIYRVDNMVIEPTGIALLPNEILISILSPFSTLDLLPLTAICHRFYDAVLRIVHKRLVRAASLKDHTLILECFHPSTKLSTPYLLCDYLGTDFLSKTADGVGDLYKGVGKTGRLGVLSGLYSHFRPVQPEEDRKPRRRHPAGDVPGYLNASTWFPGPSNGPSEKQDEPYVCQNISLESHELFSQLCTITNLVKVGPKRGLFVSCVNIGEGVTRVWRDWLAERAMSADAAGKVAGKDGPKNGKDKNRLLWADAENNVGLGLRVFERDDVPAPVFVRSDEDAPVSYTIQYEELVIRTSRLLLMVEQALDQEVNHSGKAIVIASWI